MKTTVIEFLKKRINHKITELRANDDGSVSAGFKYVTPAVILEEVLFNLDFNIDLNGDVIPAYVSPKSLRILLEVVALDDFETEASKMRNQLLVGEYC